jgi:peptidoglycan hydrolase-like protein with peptidoglycan-binding domain
MLINLGTLVASCLVVLLMQAGSVGANAQNDQQWLQERVEGESTRIYLSTASVRSIQRELNLRGFDTQVDGIWGADTRAAVLQYQRSAGLEPTGSLTIQLINSLGLHRLLSGEGDQAEEQVRIQWLQEGTRDAGEPLYVSPASVRQIQQALNRQGYDAGTVDGIWGEKTTRAAADFQRANGLEPTGKLDVNLVITLELAQDLFGSSRVSGQDVQAAQWDQEYAVSRGTPLWAGPATVRQVESALNTEGYDAGNVNGVWGDRTARAAENYQRARGMEPTGTLTTQLLGRLGLSNWLSGSEQEISSRPAQVEAQ